MPAFLRATIFNLQKIYMEQNYNNHSRYVPVYHIVAPLLLMAATAGAIWNLTEPSGEVDGRIDGVVLMTLVLAAWLIWWYARVFALKAQDRVIMLEENIRHQQLTGNKLDSRLRTSQVVALRFASDSEFPTLAQRAATENLRANEIKKAITSWRPDTRRV